MRKLISPSVLLFVIAAVSAQAQNPDIFVTPIPSNPFTGTVKRAAVIRAEGWPTRAVENGP
jgi:hypothetical protein